MSRGKYQSPKRKLAPALMVILIFAALVLPFGGVWAYLLHSAGSVSNSFTVDVNPTISVDDTYKVTVSNTQYPVYLRAAVVVSWKSTTGGKLLAAMPVEGADYQVNTSWEKRDGSFYYYTEVVDNGTIDEPLVTLSGSKDGYTLVADIAVQAVQAIGTVDDATTPAVQDAWGVTP